MNNSFIFLNDKTIFIDDVPNDCICGICKKVLKDASSPECGCLMCSGCVQDLVMKGMEYCPNEEKYCKLAKLEKVLLSHHTNRKIEQLKIKCPNNPSCNFVGMIIDMTEHNQTCSYRSSYCPYRDIGCLVNIMTQKDIEAHITTEGVSHANLLIKKFDDDSQFDNVYREMIQQNDKEIKSLKGQVNTNKNNMKKNSKDETDSIDELKIDYDTKFDTFTEKNDELKEEIKVLRRDLESRAKECLMQKEKFEQEQAKLREDLKKIEAAFTAKICGMQETMTSGELVWRVEGLEQERDKAKQDPNHFLQSPVFYDRANGYRLCLRILPGGSGDTNGEYLSIAVHAMPASHNSCLKWPCPVKVGLSLVNQDTNENSFEFEMDLANFSSCVQPTTGIGKPCAYPKFAPWGALTTNQALMKDGCIVVKCVVRK